MIQKYNLEDITTFIKAKLKNVTQTYLESDLQQKHVLLCSIFPSGLHWDGKAYLNTVISEFYTSIMALQNVPVQFGGVFSPLLEPTLSGLAIDFSGVFKWAFFIGG